MMRFNLQQLHTIKHALQVASATFQSDAVKLRGVEHDRLARHFDLQVEECEKLIAEITEVTG